MGIVARQSILSTILLYAGAIIGYINILYFFPRFLSTDQIGTVRTIQDMAALFVPIAQFGLTQSLIRFFPKLGLAESKRSGFLSLILLLGVVGYAIFYLLFQVFSSSIESYFSTNAAEIVTYFPIVLGITFLLLIYNLLVAYCQSLLNIVAPNFIKDVLFRVVIAALLLMYFYDVVNFDELMKLLLAAYGLMTLSILSFLAGRGELKLSLDFSFLSGPILRQMLIYALFSLFGASGMLIIGKIDSMMVTGMLGTSLNGVYTTVFYIAVVIELPKRAINQISLPLVSRAFEKDDINSIRTLYKQTSINQLIVGTLLFLGIWINMDNIFALMPNGEQFEVGKWVVLFIGLGRIMDMMAGINSEIIVMSRYYKFNMVLLGLLAISTILLNLWLIPIYGINGAAIGSATALVLFNLAKFIFLKWKYNIQPLSVSTLIVLILGAVGYFVSELIPQLDNTFIDLIIRSAIFFIIFFSGLIIFKPSPEITKFTSIFFRK